MTKKFGKFVGEGQLVYFVEGDSSKSDAKAKGDSMTDAQSIKGKCTQINEAIKINFDSAGATEEVLHFDTKDVVHKKPIKLDADIIKRLAGKDGEVNALNGWYGRAIDAKKLLLDGIKKEKDLKMFLDAEEVMKDTKVEQFVELAPVATPISEDGILGKWSANERAEFLLLEQKAVAIGKLIHKGCKLHELYNAPMAVTSRIVKMPTGGGTEKSYPVTVTPMFTKEELTPIREQYLALHDQHRELEKKVNWYKAKLHNQMTDAQAEAQKNYSDLMGEWQKKQSEHNEKQTQMLQVVRTFNKQLTAKAEATRASLTREASALKIFIPEALRATKDFVEKFDINKL